MIRKISFFILACCISVIAQQGIVAPQDEPTNLNTIKQELKRYYSCPEANCYGPQLEHQADIAIRFLQKSVESAKPGERLAIVLDVDETALSNWAVELRDDFGYIPADSNSCVIFRCSKAIPSTLRIFREAVKHKVAVFFITGRPEGQRIDTAANLRVEGYDGFEDLFMRPEDHPKDQTVSQYKSGARGKIVAKGYRIVLNVGDQMSDLVGEPQAEHSVKMPNPFYFIP